MAKRKVKRFDGEEGSAVSLEEKYPGAKITRGEYQGKPEGYDKHDYQLRDSVEKRNLAPYEQRESKVGPGSRSGSRGGGGGGGYMPIDKALKANKMFYKGGGKVSSASKRADGCAVKGKTKGRMI